MSHNVLNAVLGQRWSAMRGYIERFSQVVGRVTPVDIFESDIFALLFDWNLEVVHRE